jgi:hypothetical protein
LNVGAVWFQLRSDGGEIYDSAFGGSDEGKERLVHLQSVRPSASLPEGESRTHLECSLIIRLQRHPHILNRILVVEIHPCIVDQCIDAAFLAHQLHKFLDAFGIRDIELWVLDGGSVGSGRSKCEIRASTGGGVEDYGAGGGEGEDAVADCFADSSVL